MLSVQPPALDQVLPWIQQVGDRPLLILKDSPTCGTSRVARREFERYLLAHANVLGDYVIVDVLGQRPLSQAIAKATGVHHESPQVLLIHHGQVVWHTSHISINEAALTRQVARLHAPPADAANARAEKRA